MYQRGMQYQIVVNATDDDMLEASLQETDEDHPGVTLMRSGDSVIIINKTCTLSICIMQIKGGSEPGWNHGKMFIVPALQ